MASNGKLKRSKGVGIVGTLFTTGKLLFEACGPKEIGLLTVGLLGYLIPAGMIFLQKEFFNHAEQLVIDPSSTVIRDIAVTLALWSGLMLAQWVVGIIEGHASRLVNIRINNYMMNRLLGKIGSIRYEYMDTPEVFNKLEWVSRELPNRIAQVVYSSLGFVGSLLAGSSVGALGFSEDWRIALIIIAGGIPACLFVHLQNDEEYYRAQWESPELRQQWHVFRLFTRRDSIREMRVGQYSDYLMEKWADLSLQLRNHRYKYIRKYYLFNVLSNIFNYASIGVALWIVCLRIFDPVSGTGIGSFMLVYGVAMSLQGDIISLFSDISGVAATGKYLKDYYDLLRYDSEELAGEDDPLPENGDITFENVWFHYPNTDRYVLQDINVTIKQGEKVAIVGENGSGKSTFVALLCGLYQPQRGRITFAGKELSEVLGLMRRATSFVFQDFGRYQLTVADNIRIGNTYRELTEGEIITAAKRADADGFIQEMEQKYNTFLGSLEQGRMDLSGGQWQKLAFARCITRQEAKVMILDEQTAALDPISEARFYREFRELTGDRTAIMISHRLGATKLADRILVFHEGRIVEEGTHEKLMSKNGLYAQMYEAQAQWYTA